MLHAHRALSLLPLVLVLLAGSGRGDVFCACQPASSPCGNFRSGPLPAGCVNSTGERAFLGPIGSLSVSTDDLVLSAFDLPARAPTLLLLGGGSKHMPFGDGVLCISGGAKGLFHYPPQVAGPTGAVASGPRLVTQGMASFPAAGWIHAGETWYFQRWYRDVDGPCGSGFNLTNGLGLTFVP